MMIVDVDRALAAGGMVEVTTTGRRSGQPRRIRIAAHNVAGRVYLSGRPGRRDWYANLRARPELVVHLGGEDGLAVDLPARARPVTDADERGRVLSPIARGWRADLAEMVRSSPLVEVTFVEPLAGLSRLGLGAGRGRQPSALVEV